MSETETTEGHTQVIVPALNPNGKAEKNKAASVKLGKKLKLATDDHTTSGRVKTINVKNVNERNCGYQFDLTDKKGKCHHYALDASDDRRLSIFAGLINVAQSTNAKVTVTFTSNANGQDVVTGLEVKARR